MNVEGSIPIQTQQTFPIKKKGILSQYRKNKYLFILFTPVVLYYLIFHYAPIYGIIIAFKDYYPVKGFFDSPWVGFKHFDQLFTGMYFLPVLKNTLIISAYNLIFGFPAPIILAIFLNEIKNLAFKKTVQSITYLPHFISWVTLSGIVIEILSPSRGPINILLTNLGFDPIFFVADPHYFRGVLVLSHIWKEIGWGSIVYLAAITTIDPELYDVADIDGAGRFRKVLNITLPSIAPVIVIMFIFAIGNIIKDDFDQIYNLLNPNVLSVGDVISTYTYSEGIKNMNFSFATAVDLFKNVIAFTLVMTANYFSKKVSEYGIW